MPTICSFFGIVIRMYFDDHAPPHFHVYYGEHQAVFRIETLEMTEGHLPKRAKAMVLEWAAEHQQELMTNWNLADGHRPLRKILPLE